MADGDDIGTGNLTPGCYEMYVEDERGCTSTNDTGGNLEEGLVFFWTVYGTDLNC